jgi:hypothetical protein
MTIHDSHFASKANRRLTMKKGLMLGMMTVGLLWAAPALADDVRTERVQFEKGATSARLEGTVVGYQSVDYLLGAAAGQEMSVRISADNRFLYFNVIDSSTEDALFVGSSAAEPNRWSGTLPSDGDYKVQVYLMRNEARRSGKAGYSLDISITTPSPVRSAAGADETVRGFDQVLSLQGITFHVSCPNEGSLNQLKIVPGGLEIDNSVITEEVDGSVTGAEVADINGDGSPEIYVFVNSAGSGAYGSLVAHSANNNKSLSPIYLPPLEDDAEHSKGYMGHDEFTVIENSLARRFPIYKEGDTNVNPTGGTRQLQYELVAGEATWQLQLVKSTSF